MYKNAPSANHGRTNWIKQNHPYSPSDVSHQTHTPSHSHQSPLTSLLDCHSLNPTIPYSPSLTLSQKSLSLFHVMKPLMLNNLWNYTLLMYYPIMDFPHTSFPIKIPVSHPPSLIRSAVAYPWHRTSAWHFTFKQMDSQSSAHFLLLVIFC